MSDSIKEYVAIAATGKMKQMEDLKKLAEQELLQHTHEFQRTQKCFYKKPLGAFDNVVWLCGKLGFKFTINDEATINKVRFMTFNKNLHRDYSRLIFDLNEFILLMM